jgi:SOS-response transcriptional repressor LexA
MPKKGFIPNKLRPWIEARKKHRLSHAQIQMARELGLNPKKFGGMANHKKELWKSTLPDYIEHLYEKHFGKKMPDDIRSLEVRDAEKRKRKAQNKADRLNHMEQEESVS